MPALKKTIKESVVLSTVGDIEKARTEKQWDRKHLAQLLPWRVKHKYEKLNGFYRHPELIPFGDLVELCDKLGLKVTVEKRG